jgi:7-cyano-7-deazaguanine synthase in queuosine biosynthesis
MEYILKPRDRIFNQTTQFPDNISKVGIGFSGGMESSLIAKLAIDKYGVDNVSLFMLSGIFNRNDERAIEIRKANMHKVMDYLNIPLDKLTVIHFDYDLHTADRGLSLASVNDYMALHFPEIEKIYFGFTNVFFDVAPLREPGITMTEINKLLTENTTQFERVIAEFHTNTTDEYISVLHRNMDIGPESYTHIIENDKVMTPFDNLDKGEIVDLYYQLGLTDLLYNTGSCTDGKSILVTGNHCGKCFNCQQRFDGHIDSNRLDLTVYDHDVVKYININR